MNEPTKVAPTVTNAPAPPVSAPAFTAIATVTPPAGIAINAPTAAVAAPTAMPTPRPGPAMHPALYHQGSRSMSEQVPFVSSADCAPCSTACHASIIGMLGPLQSGVWKYKRSFVKAASALGSGRPTNSMQTARSCTSTTDPPLIQLLTLFMLFARWLLGLTELYRLTEG